MNWEKNIGNVKLTCKPEITYYSILRMLQLVVWERDLDAPERWRQSLLKMKVSKNY